MEILLKRDTEIPAQYQAIALGVLPTVEGWLKDRYGLPPGFFSGLTVLLSCTQGRNLYRVGEKQALIRVASSRLYLYNIVDAEKTTPLHGLPVGVAAYIALSILHEATHYIQDIKGRKDFSELETTVNQLDFMEAFFPMDFFFLVEATGGSMETGVVG